MLVISPCGFSSGNWVTSAKFLLLLEPNHWSNPKKLFLDFFAWIMPSHWCLVLGKEKKAWSFSGKYCIYLNFRPWHLPMESSPIVTSRGTTRTGSTLGPQGVLLIFMIFEFGNNKNEHSISNLLHFWDWIRCSHLAFIWPNPELF